MTGKDKCFFFLASRAVPLATNETECMSTSWVGNAREVSDISAESCASIHLWGVQSGVVGLQGSTSSLKIKR